MRKQAWKASIIRLLAIGLVCMSLVAFGPRAQAADTSAIVSAAFQMYSLLSKQLHSEFDPTHSDVLRNQELLKDLELRFMQFENAIEDAIDRLDRLPIQYRDILRIMLDEMQGNRVLALVDQIIHDQAIIDRGKIPTIDPKARLHDLQVETGVLSRRGDLNAPTLIVAYGYELALMASLGAHPEETKQRRERYNERLLRILDGNNPNSLAHSYSVGMRETKSEFDEINWKKDLNYYLGRTTNLSARCVAQKCLMRYMNRITNCEFSHGERLTDVGRSVVDSVTRLLQSLEKQDSKLLKLQQQVSILWSWEAILRSVVESVPQELQEERHRRALRDHANPETLNSEVRKARADITKIRESLQTLGSTYLREEHQFAMSTPPAGELCQ